MRTVKREYNQKFGGKTKKFNFKNVNEYEYDIIKIKMNTTTSSLLQGERMAHAIVEEARKSRM